MESLSAIVRCYQQHLDEGGRSTPEDFLRTQPDAPEAALEALRVVAAMRAKAAPAEEFGPYRLLEELGRGAQATVYLAEDTRLGRRVALKILLPTASSGAASYLRMQREAAAASRLDHSNICTVYEAGVQDGLPYIAMRFVDGETLSRRIATGDLLERVRRIERVARALHVAHEAGLLHRDIKPGNIMITRDGEPVLCDFGLARAEGDEVAALTRTGETPGTPAYMSPEQLRGKPLDRRSDVYSLGVVLYEDATGARPFEAATLDELYRRILLSDPAPPRDLPRDLRVVLETALDKDRNRRYATAEHFAEDLRRVRRREPITARPPGPLRRLRRWAQRRPALAASLFLVVAGAIAFAIQQRRSLERLEAEHRVTEWRTYVANIFAADASLRSAEPGDAQPRLDACDERMRGWEWRYLRHKSDASLACLEGGGRMTCVAASADGARVAAGSDDRTIRVWENGEERVLRGHTERVRAVAFRPGAGTLASAGDDRTVRLWQDGRLRHTLAGHRGDILALAFTPDGARLCSGGMDATVRVWDPEAGVPLRRIDYPCAVRAIAAVDGARIVVGLRDGSVVVTDLADGAGRTLARCDAAIQAVAVEGDLVAACPNRAVHVLDLRTGDRTGLLRGHRRQLSGVAFAPGGRLVTTSFDGTVRTWTTSGTPLASQLGHTRLVSGLALTAGGAWTSSSDGTVRFWSLEPRGADVLLRTARANVNALAFSPDGKRLACGTWSPLARVLDVASGDILAVLRGHAGRVTEIRFDPAGRRIATASTDRTVRIWDAATGECLTVLRGHTDDLGGVAFSPDGRRIASCGSDRTVRIWDAATGRPLRLLAGHEGGLPDVVWSGGRIASASDRGTVRVWDAERGECLAVLRGHVRGARMPAFHPDGRHLATAAGDGTIRLWDLDDGSCVRTLDGHTDTVFALDFHPDGTRLLSVSRDHTARVWDVASGETVLILHGHDALLSCGAFSPDGRRIATGSYDRTVRLWEIERPEGYYAAQAQRAALRAQAAALLEPGFSLDVLARLRADATLPAALREHAVRLVLEREEDPEELAERARTLMRADPRQARELVREALRLSPAPRYLLLLGAACYRLGEYEEALRHLDRPGVRRPDATAFLAMTLFRLGEERRARTALQACAERVRQPQYRDSSELQVLLDEARALIGE